MANILVIDDEPAVCEILQTFLENAGYIVRTTTTTHNLPELLATPPDVVLLDVLMPETNGLECLPQIKRLVPNCHVVIITGVDDYRIADLFYEAGAHSFLTKPIRHQHLLETLQKIEEIPSVPPCPEIDF
ncbi:MAG: response regulator [Candidatus Latescibacteria bacterium]|jgi:DNA-binding NtrC family response regulator|nr:response regulator [Candidatus Latescibacterota bacterium]